MEKIKFSSARQTKTVELPSFKGSQVEVYTSLTVGEQRDLNAKFPNASDPKSSDAMDSIFGMIEVAIKTTNFTDENDNDLPLTIKEIRQLSEADITVLVEAITGKTLKEDSSIDKTEQKKS